jgi:hypothetical protein
MNKTVLTLAALAFFNGLAISSEDPFQNTLVLYDFNNVGSFVDPNRPAYCSPCISATDLCPNDLAQTLKFCGGPDGSRFRCFDGWEKTAANYSVLRSDLSQAVNTLAFQVHVNPADQITLSSFGFDWMRTGAGSVDTIQASVFWKDANGAIQYNTTGPVGLTGTGTWNRLDFTSSYGSTDLISGLDTSGTTLYFEIFAYGADGGELCLDNITLNGDCAPIPEPSGALLIGAAGVILLVRRRSRFR